MSKKIISIIAGAVVIVMLSGMLVYLKNNSAPEGTAVSSAVSEESVSLITENEDDFLSAKIKNPKDEYTIEKTKANELEINDLNGFSQDASKYSMVQSELASLSALKVIAENCTDLSPYGFNDPTAQVEVKFKNGKTYALTLGAVAPDKSKQYLIETGKNTVYLISSSDLSSLNRTKNDYLSNTVVEAKKDKDGNNVLPDVTYFKISRPDMEKPIIFDDVKKDTDTEKSINMLHMTSPVAGLINETKAQSDVYSVFGLEAESVVKVNPTAEDIALYGLDKPTSILEIKYDGNSSIKLITGCGIDAQGNKTENADDIVSYYAMKDGLKEVFLLESSKAKWNTVKAKELLGPSIVLPYISDVKNVDVILEKKYVLGIESTEVKDTSSDSNKTKVKQSFTLNGKDVNESDGRHFYSLLLSTSVQDINKKAPTVKASATIIYHLVSGRSIKIEVFVEPDLTTIISLNGNNGYIGRFGYVDKLEREIKNLEQGKSVNMDW